MHCIQCFHLPCTQYFYLSWVHANWNSINDLLHLAQKHYHTYIYIISNTRFSEQHNPLLPKVRTNYGKQFTLFLSITACSSPPTITKSFCSEASLYNNLKKYVLITLDFNSQRTLYLVCTTFLFWCFYIVLCSLFRRVLTCICKIR